MDAIEGCSFKLKVDGDTEEYYVINKVLQARGGRKYEAWCFFMYDIIMGDLQYVGNLSYGLFMLTDAVNHFKKHKGEPPEWREKTDAKR